LESSFDARDEEVTARLVRDVEEAVATLVDEYLDATLTIRVNIGVDTSPDTADVVRVSSGGLVRWSSTNCCTTGSSTTTATTRWSKGR